MPGRRQREAPTSGKTPSAIRVTPPGKPGPYGRRVRADQRRRQGHVESRRLQCLRHVAETAAEARRRQCLDLVSHSNLSFSMEKRRPKPDARLPGGRLGSAPSTDRRSEGILMLVRGASVPIDVAAELANVEVRVIRQWAAIDALKIEWRGGMEVVPLDQVQTLSGWAGRRTGSNPRHAALRGRLRGVMTDTLSVTGLQKLAQERGAASKG